MAGPVPRSKIRVVFMAMSASIPQRLAGLQRVRDAFLRLPFSAQAEERLPLQIEQLLLRHGPAGCEPAAGEDLRELPSDERIVIADASAAPREVDTELQRREHPF